MTKRVALISGSSSGIGQDINLLINSAGLGYFEPHEELSVSKIINISSIEALKASKFSAAYSASKAGLHHFGNSLFEEVRKAGVNIISIHPDMTQTPF
ncbi:MAG TPA: SDR family NAD(P)-dependent oxidoreductase, partial [Sulfurimonas sp.]|nr:SDR family NAD(P)-dependent oxidoreductase [Sulfurimonas sp.]